MSRLPRSNLPAPQPSDRFEKISLMVYETLVSIQQQQPEWIIERHRQSPLSQCKIMFVCQLQEMLEEMYRCASIGSTLKQFLQQICTISSSNLTTSQTYCSKLTPNFSHVLTIAHTSPNRSPSCC
ncbi:MAG: hypothetical protein HC895_15330 [Leptolyngbyaceae cyanobacterium SM1_3_5]|nr:hypothetical protein [Leptolyngbyaceae cyanobacterium SM1_3_5]